MFELLGYKPSFEEEPPPALIGLGRRGCMYAQQLHQVLLEQALPIKSHAFLIDHDPESCQEDAPSAGILWISHVETVFSFTPNLLIAVVIVGAEHQNSSELHSFKVGLQKERPALLLGIVLPSPEGEPVRIESEFLKELDSVIWWPNDPALPESGALLPIIVNDWLAPLWIGGLICIDFADMVYIFSGNPQPVVVMSVNVTVAQPRTAIHAALASFEQQGFKLDQAMGLLIVVSADVMCSTIWNFEAITSAITERLPDAINIAATMVLNNELQDELRVTLFFAGPAIRPVF